MSLPRARPIGRAVLSAAVLILGGVAVLRLPLAFQPAWSLPELRVNLSLPETTELTSLTRRWIQPLESSIRAAGDVRGLAGEVHGSGGNFRVRFRAGIDAERKLARLESELTTLRRRLPTGARLQIWPVGQGAGDESAILWLGEAEGAGETEGGHTSLGPGIDRSLIEALRDLPEVRSVEVAGEKRREVRVRARPAGHATAAELRSAIDDGLRVTRLGQTRIGDRWLPVKVADQRRLTFGDFPIRQGSTWVPLRAVADVGLREEEPPWIAHLEGQRGRVLLISREVESSPLDFDRALRQTFRTFGLEGQTRALIEEAAPLRQLLMRLLGGLAVATVLLAWVTSRLFGWGAGLWQAFALPVALAAAANGLWLADLPLDVTTLPPLVAGLGAALFFTAFRVGPKLAPRATTVGWFATGEEKALTIAAAVLTLPVAVALAGGTLAPLLAAPVRAFVIAVAAGIGALWLLPRSTFERLPPRWIARPLKWTLRNPWTVLLGGVVAGYLLLVLSGRALEPRTGNLTPAVGDLAIRLRFADGTTVEQASAQISAVERHLEEAEEVIGHWSVFGRQRGTVIATARRGDRSLHRLAPLARRLQGQLGAVGASVQVSPLAGMGGGESVARLSDSLEDLAETDDESTFYRFVLRHTDAEALQLAHAAVMDRLATFRDVIWYDQIHADWARPSVRVELLAKPGTSPEQVSLATQAVVVGGALPRSRPLAADRDLSLRVLDPRSPDSRDQVAARNDLLGLQATPAGTAIVPVALLEARQVVASPTIKRQSGRFALPMTLTVVGSIEAVRKRRRARIDRGLATLNLPGGTTLERPELNPAIWSRERLSLLAIAGSLPVLFFALAACRLSSLGAAVATLMPPLLGVAAAAPLIQATRGHLDELTLLMLAAALAGSFAVPLEAAAVSSRVGFAPLAAGAAYRWLSRRAVGFAAVLPAVFALLIVPGLGLDNDRHPWVLPLRVAGVASVTVVLVSFWVLPVLLRTMSRLRSARSVDADPHAEILAAVPGSSSEERSSEEALHFTDRQDLVLTARHLTKIYGDGFHALHAVNFQLEPGIVGLLGPNGAGKTTLLRLLCGLLEPSRGQVRFQGVPLQPANLADYRHLVGFLPQGFNAYEGFTGADFLDYWAIERGLLNRRDRRKEVERVLSQVGLEDVAGRKVRDFSGGMRRRIGIARALLGSPPIVIVDEPTTGLDVESRNRLRETLLDVAGERIILFSTHIASDVAAAASRILVLDRGRLMFDGPALDLIAAACGRVFEALVDDQDLPDFSQRFRVTTRVRSLEGLKVRAIVYGEAEPAGELVEPNLEEAYLTLIGAPGERDQHRSGEPGSLLDLAAWDSRRR